MDWSNMGMYLVFGGFLLPVVAGAVTLLIAGYHFGKAVSHAKQPYFAALFGMLAPFMPSQFDENGNRHRTLFFRYLLITVPLWGVPMLVYELVLRR